MFGQAQGAAGQAFNQQTALAVKYPHYNPEIFRNWSIGGIQQAQQQAQLGATQEANRMQAMEPYDRLGIYGQGVTGLISGYPGQYQSMSQPNPTALQNCVGYNVCIRWSLWEYSRKRSNCRRPKRTRPNTTGSRHS